MSVTLLDSIEEKTFTENGVTCTSFSIGGTPHAAVICGAVRETYPRADIDWDILVGRKVTMLLGGETAFGAGVIAAEEATIFRGSSGDLAYLPKGKRSHGFRLNPARVLDVVDGYNGTAELRCRVDTARAAFPHLVELTRDRLAQLPLPTWADGQATGICTLAVFGRWAVGGETGTNQALWLCETYEPEEDIVEGVLFVPDSVGCSENGSTYGKDLLRFGGEVAGFKPVSFADALVWTDRPHAEVLAQVVEQAREAG